MIAIIGKERESDVITKYLKDHYGDYHREYANDSYWFEVFGMKDQIPLDYQIIIGFYNMTLRRRVFKAYARYRFLNIIRSKLPAIECGVSNIIEPGVMVDMFTEMGDNNIISANTAISHHCKIGSGNIIGMGCSINRSVTIGNDNTIGPGVIIMPNIIIGDNVTIEPGTIVQSDMLAEKPEKKTRVRTNKKT